MRVAVGPRGKTSLRTFVFDRHAPAWTGLLSAPRLHLHRHTCFHACIHTPLHACRHHGNACNTCAWAEPSAPHDTARAVQHLIPAARLPALQILAFASLHLLKLQPLAGRLLPQPSLVVSVSLPRPMGIILEENKRLQLVVVAGFVQGSAAEQRSKARAHLLPLLHWLLLRMNVRVASSVLARGGSGSMGST